MAGGDVRSLKRAINYAMSNIGMLMTAPAAAYVVVSVCFEGSLLITWTDGVSMHHGDGCMQLNHAMS